MKMIAKVQVCPKTNLKVFQKQILTSVKASEMQSHSKINFSVFCNLIALILH